MKHIYKNAWRGPGEVHEIFYRWCLVSLEGQLHGKLHARKKNVGRDISTPVLRSIQEAGCRIIRVELIESPEEDLP